MPQNSKSPSELIDARIEELGDWRGELLGRLRALVKEADPEVVEEWKWRGVPMGATKAVGPTQANQILQAGVFLTKPTFQFGQCSWVILAMGHGLTTRCCIRLSQVHTHNKPRPTGL